ncbi:RHS repeat-associated core domain-containing protein [Herbidospora sp. RD11066]
MTGRFLQVDPVMAGSANDNEYCNGDPVNFSDPSGRRRIAHGSSSGPGTMVGPTSAASP